MEHESGKTIILIGELAKVLNKSPEKKAEVSVNFCSTRSVGEGIPKRSLGTRKDLTG